MKRILFMSEEEARTTLYCAGLNEEYEFYVVGNIERNQTIQYHPYCKKFINLKNKLELETDTQALVDELIDIIRNESIDILLPVSIACLLIVDRHKPQLQQEVTITPFPSKESVDLLDHKYNFYLFCKEHDIAHPESVCVNTSAEIDASAPGVSYPLLIKPVLGAGGFDTLVFVRTEQEMEAFLQRPIDKREGYFPALLQEYFDGQDIDFNGFSVDGKVLASSVMKTDFYENNPELNFTYFVHDDDVTRLGNKILEAGKYSGPTNIDMRIRASDGKLMLIEVNPRYWARVHVSLMDGMNFLDIGIKATLGEAYESYSYCPRRRWVSSPSALIKAIVKDFQFRYIKDLVFLSWQQIRFLAFNRKFMAQATRLLKDSEAG